jgi:hypothetical protein
MFAKKNRRYLLFILAIAIFSSLSTMAFMSYEKAKDIEQIKKVVTTGPREAYHSGMLPQAYRDNPNLEVPSDVVISAKKRVKEKLDKYYDINSAIYKLRYQQYTEAVDAEAKTKNRDLGGGIKKVEKLDVSLNGDTAKVEMICVVWAKLKAEDGTIYTPENKVKYNFELKKINGEWKITSEDFTLPEGI